MKAPGSVSVWEQEFKSDGLAFVFVFLLFGSWLSVTFGPRVAVAQAITRGPYLQMNTPSSIVIVWRTNNATNSRVQIGPSPGTWTRTISDATSVLQHEIRITGLQPATRYYYNVGTSTQVLGGGSAPYYFVTSPPHGSNQPFRFWIVGDSGTGGTTQKRVRDVMLQATSTKPPDLYLHMGDMAYGSGTNSEFQSNFFDIYQSILRHTVCWPTMGNHEGRSSRSGPQTGPYYDAYVLPKNGEAGGLASGTEAYYSFDYANVHFIVLDSHDSPRTTSGAMLTWLKNDLAATKQRWIVAYWHHPPYTKGSHDSDTESQLIQMRRYALPILEAGGVDLVLGGHSHIYERSYLIHGAYETPSVATGKIIDKGDGKIGGDGAYQKPPGGKGAVYVVAGHGGTGVSQKGTHPLMYFTERDNGSCIVDVSGNSLTLINLRDDGKQSDTFTLVKGDGLLLLSPNGGETYSYGDKTQIRWRSFGTVAQVHIDFSSDGGQSWRSVAKNVPNNGAHNWSVPYVASTKALVRITNAQDATQSDQSNAFFTIGQVVPKKFISFGGTWKYHDKGQDLGTSWFSTSFDDSAWPSGAAQLGYGDGDEATALTRPTPRHPSVYFRKTIQVDRAVTEALLRLIHDDGVAVWVNGRLVFSKYVNNGLSYSAWASSTSSDNEASEAKLTLAPSPFVVGKNTIAVMIKQRSATSSDISFDLELTLTLSPPPPPEPPPAEPPPPEPTQEPSVDADVADAGVADAGVEPGQSPDNNQANPDPTTNPEPQVSLDTASIDNNRADAVATEQSTVSPDSGSSFDAVVLNPDTGSRGRDGCSCQSSSNIPASSLLLLLLLLLVRKRAQLT